MVVDGAFLLLGSVKGPRAKPETPDTIVLAFCVRQDRQPPLLLPYLAPGDNDALLYCHDTHVP